MAIVGREDTPRKSTTTKTVNGQNYVKRGGVYVRKSEPAKDYTNTPEFQKTWKVYVAERFDEYGGLAQYDADVNSFINKYGTAINGITYGADGSVSKAYSSEWKAIEKRNREMQEYFEAFKNDFSDPQFANKKITELQEDATNFSRGLEDIQNAEKYYGQWKDQAAFEEEQRKKENNKRLLMLNTEKEDASVNELQALYDEVAEMRAHPQRDQKYNTGLQAYREKMRQQGKDLNNPYDLRKSYDEYLRKQTDEAATSRLKEAGYNSLEELDSEIKRRNEDIRQARMLQQANTLFEYTEAARNDPAFYNYVSAGRDSAKAEQRRKAEQQENPLGALGVSMAGANYGPSAPGLPTFTLSDLEREYPGTLTEEEKQVLYYYQAKAAAGKISEEKLQEYYAALSDEQAKRGAQEMYDAVLKESTGLKYLYGAHAGLDQYFSGLAAWSDKDGYVEPTQTAYTSGLVREGIKEQHGGVGQAAYDLITTTANMLPSIALGVAADFVLPGSGSWVNAASVGASAGGQAYAEMVNNGYSTEQARLYGYATGALEAGLEKVLNGVESVGKGFLTERGIKTLTERLSGIPNAMVRWAATNGVNLVGNSIGEGVEEGLQDIISPFVKLMLTGDWEGVDWNEVGYSALLGALSAVPFNAVNTAADTSKRKAVVMEAIENGDIDTLIELGRQYDADSMTAQFVNRVDTETPINKRDVRNLSRALGTAQPELQGQVERRVRDAIKREGVTGDAESVMTELAMRQIGGEKLSDSDISLLDALDVGTGDKDARRIFGRVLNKAADIRGDVAGVLNAFNAAVNGDTEKRGVDFAQRKANSQRSERMFGIDVTQQGTRIDKENGVFPKKIVSFENGKMQLELTDGKKVDADSVKYANTDEALLYEGVRMLKTDPETANAIIQTGTVWAIHNQTSVPAQVRDLQRAYRAGLYGDTTATPKAIPTEEWSKIYEMGRRNADTGAAGYEAGRKAYLTEDAREIAQAQSEREAAKRRLAEDREKAEARRKAAMELPNTAKEQRLARERKTLQDIQNDIRYLEELQEKKELTAEDKKDLQNLKIEEKKQLNRIENLEKQIARAKERWAKHEIKPNRSTETAANAKAERPATEIADATTKGILRHVHYIGGAKNAVQSGRQSVSIKALGIVTRAITNNEVYIYESVMKNGVRVFAEDIPGFAEMRAGTASPNGFFDPKTGAIYIDLNAGENGQGSILWTAGHELTHYLKEWNADSYNTLKEFLTEAYGESGVDTEILIQRQIDKAARAGIELTHDQAEEEMVADAMQTMFTDADLLNRVLELKARDKGLVEKIHSWLQRVAAKISAHILREYGGLRHDTAEARKLKTMVDALNHAADIFAEGLVQAGENFQAADAPKRVTATADASAEAQYSRRLDSKLMDDTEAMNTVIPKDLLNVVREQRERIKTLLQNAEYDPVTGERKLLLPEDIDGKGWVSNGSYGRSMDPMTECVRSIGYDALCDMIARKLGRPLKMREALAVSQNIGLLTDEIQCLYCYVAADRMAYRESVYTFLEDRDRAIKALQSGEISTEKEFEDIYRRGRKSTNGKYGTKALASFYFNGIKNGMKVIPSSYVADLSNDPDRIADIAKRMTKDGYNTEELTRISKYAQSASWAKKRTKYKAYTGDILKWSDNVIRNLNREFGLRFYSFADFSPAFILENMQEITDAAARGLKGLAYTKDLDFVKIFAPTNININVSIFGNMRNGVMQEDAMQGAGWAEARKLREQYENVGLVFVATNEEAVEWALDQDWIDVVIPYHTVRSGEKMTEFFSWKDFKSSQEDKIVGSKAKEDRKGKTKAIFPQQHNNDFATYMAELEKNDLSPRFPQYVDNPNYMKLVNETRRSAKDTPAMLPVFNMDAAEAAIRKMERSGGFYKPLGGSVSAMTAFSEMMAGELAQTADVDLKNISLDTTAFGERLADLQEELEEKSAQRGRDNETKGDIRYSTRGNDADVDKYSYSELLKKKTVLIPEITSVSNTKYMQYKGNRDLMAKDARAVARKENNPKNTTTETYLFFPDLDKDVKITKDSYKHGAERMDESYVNIAFSLPDIVKTAICVNELNETSDNNSGYVLLGLAEQSDSFSIVRLVVNDKTWKLDEFEELYAFKKKDIKKDGVGSNAPALPSFQKGYDSPSTISIEDFLRFVNSQNLGNAVLSNDVLTYINDTRRTNEKLTQNLRYSARRQNFSSLQEIDSRIDDLTRQRLDIMQANDDLIRNVDADERVQAAKQAWWDAEDSGDRGAAFRAKVEYRRTRKAVNEEISKGSTLQSDEDIQKEIEQLKALRADFVSVEVLTTRDYGKLVNHFGTTSDFDVAGFILKDGRMLDFSGKKQYGKQYAGGRDIYHNEVGDVVDKSGDTSPRINMVNNGNIRLVPEINGINLSMKPSKEQMYALKEFIKHNDGDVHVDIDDMAGNTIETLSYWKGASADRIIADINTYFDTGEVQKRNDSELLQYRSLRDQSAVSDRELLSVALMDAAKTEDERARLRRYQKYVETLDGMQTELQDINEQVKTLAKSKEPGDRAKEKALRQQGEKLANRINNYDKSLLKMEAATPLQNIVKRERKTARTQALQQAKQRQVEAVQKTKGHYEERLTKLRKQKNDEKAEAVKKTAEHYKQRIADVRQEGWDRLAKRNEEVKESRQRERDKRASTQLRNRIKSIRNDFMKRLLRGNENTSIPPALVQGVIDVCDFIDPTSEMTLMVRKTDAAGRPMFGQSGKPLFRTATDGEFTDAQIEAGLADGSMKYFGEAAKQKYESGKRALNDLRSAYDKLKNNKDEDFSSEFDAEFSQKIGELADAIGDTPLRDMSRDQLEDVADILSDIRHVLLNANKQIREGKAITNYETGTNIIDNMRDVVKKKIPTTKVGDLFRNWFTNPLRGVREMSGYAEDSELVRLFDDIDAGLRKGDFWRMTAVKLFDELRTGKNSKTYFNALNRAYDFGLEDVDGKPLKISKMQAMQILLTYERETQNENRRHLANFILIPDVDLMRKGKYQAALDAAQTMPALTEEALEKLREGLDTEWDKAFMETAREVFRMSSDAVNEVSLLLKGRAIATEKAYIPYEVAGDFIARANENVTYDASIEGMGMTKSMTPNSAKPIVIRGLNAVVDNHVNDVAKYYGLAVPVRNFNKAFNMQQTAADGGSSVQKEIRNAWGGGGLKLLSQAVADVQSPRRGDTIPILSKIKSNWVSATLSMNLSVWMKQMASYPTAGSILSQRALLAGMRYFGKDLTKGMRTRVWNEIDEHTAMHWLRRQGLEGTQEIGDFAQSNGLLKRISDKAGRFSPMNWIQSMDVRTTAMLWEACKTQTRLDGFREQNDAYWEHVTALYNKVIEDTQPMYDPLHRAEITKNKAQNFIMFQTQPIQNSGILREATMELRAAKKRYGLKSEEAKQASKQFAKAVVSQTVSHAVFTGMTLLAAALLHRMNPYRDDDKELDKESIAKEFTEQFAKTYFGAILPIFGNWAVSAYEYFVEGSKYDVLSEPVVDKINTTLQRLDALKKPSVNAILNAVGDLCTYLGIPFENGRKIVDGLRLHYEDIKNGEFMSFEAGVKRSVEQQINRLTRAISEGDTAMIDRIRDEIIANSDAKDPEKSADNAIKEALKTAYQNGDITDADAEMYLKDYFGTDGDDAYWLQKEWASAETDKDYDGDGEADDFSVYGDFVEAVRTGSGVEDAVKELADHGKEGFGNALSKEFKEEYTSATGSAKDALREKLLDAYEAAYKAKGEEKSRWRIQKEVLDEWDYAAANGGSTKGYSMYNDVFTAVETGVNLKAVLGEYQAEGIKASTIESQITRHFKPIFQRASNSERASMLGYLLNAYEQLGCNRNDKYKDIMTNKNSWVNSPIKEEEEK